MGPNMCGLKEVNAGSTVANDMGFSGACSHSSLCPLHTLDILDSSHIMWHARPASWAFEDSVSTEPSSWSVSDSSLGIPWSEALCPGSSSPRGFFKECVILL